MTREPDVTEKFMDMAERAFRERDEARAELELLWALLDAARICLKNRDQSEREAAVYAAICAALEPKP